LAGLAANGKCPDRRPARRPALQRRKGGVRKEADRPDNPAVASGDEQHGVRQAAPDIDDLAEIALPRIGRKVRLIFAVCLLEQRRDGVELMKLRLADDESRKAPSVGTTHVAPNTPVGSVIYSRWEYVSSAEIDDHVLRDPWVARASALVDI
jgi:hypothetical protein